MEFTNRARGGKVMRILGGGMGPSVEVLVAVVVPIESAAVGSVVVSDVVPSAVPEEDT